MRDHVAVYVVREFRQTAAPVPNHEIVAHGFFPLDALPHDTTAGTRARIAEVLTASRDGAVVNAVRAPDAVQRGAIARRRAHPRFMLRRARDTSGSSLSSQTGRGHAAR